MPSRHSIVSSIGAAVFLAVGSWAEGNEPVSFTTVDGKHYTGVTVSRTVGRKLEVITPTGTQLVRFKNLPKEIQERFFDPSMMYPPKVGDLLDFNTLDGKTFKGPLREVAPNGISITTPDGVEKIAYSNLPPELANSFDYDADDAAHYEALMKERQRRALVARQTAERQAAEQAARQRSFQPLSTPRPVAPESAMGDRGTQRLGAPQLGGRGLGK